MDVVTMKMTKADLQDEVDRLTRWQDRAVGLLMDLANNGAGEAADLLLEIGVCPYCGDILTIDDDECGRQSCEGCFLIAETSKRDPDWAIRRSGKILTIKELRAKGVPGASPMLAADAAEGAGR